MEIARGYRRACVVAQRRRDLRPERGRSRSIGAAWSAAHDGCGRLVAGGVLASAIDVGDAYRLLKDPLRRAKWLIERAAQLAGQQASVIQQLERADPEFLMDIMEQREALSAARRSGNLSEALALAGPIREREAAALSELSEALDSGPVARLLADSAAFDDSSRASSESKAVDTNSGASSDPALATALSSAAACLSRLRYLRRFLDEVAAIEDELD